MSLDPTTSDSGLDLGQNQHRRSNMSPDSTAFDSVLDLCQHRYRRIVLGVLAGEQRSLTLTDLTEAVLKYNHQTSVTEASEEELREIDLCLHHIHLPKLVEKGIIHYDPKLQVADLIKQPEQVQHILSTILKADSLETPMEL